MVIAYESPHRIVALMERVAKVWPGCRVCVCCDLTKLYERIDRGPCEEVLAALRANPNVEKGEYCAVIECPPPAEDAAPASGEKSPEERLLALLLEGMDPREAVDAAVEAGVPRNAAKKARLALERLAERLAAE